MYLNLSGSKICKYLIRNKDYGKKILSKSLNVVCYAYRWNEAPASLVKYTLQCYDKFQFLFLAGVNPIKDI